MQLLSSLLTLAGCALLIIGIAAIVLNRTGALGRPSQRRVLPRTLSDQIQVMLVPSDGGCLILDLGSVLPQTPTPAP